MLPCLKPAPSTNNYVSSPPSQGYSTDKTPTSSVQLSPTVNLSREYTLAIQTNSYSEIRTTFDQIIDTEHIEIHDETPLLDHVLKPGRQCVQDSLSLTRPNSLTRLVSTYFEHSEQTSRLCLILYHTVHRARLIYTPIHNLLEDLPLELDSLEYSLSDSQCKFVYNIFLQFDCLENPFLPPDSSDFDDIRRCFSLLRQKLDRRLKKSKSMGPASCLIALVASPTCGFFFPSSRAERETETARVAQLEAASKGVYVLYNDVDTIDRLVARLHAAVENDRLLVQMGLERGMDRYPVQEILKQLRRNRAGFVKQLLDLEEHLFLCFAAINRARSILLQEIDMHRTSV